MHTWGDAWFEKHGEDLGKAISMCMSGWWRWGRIGSHGKEKYGTFRDHVYLYSGYWPLHELIKPGYVAYRWPKWTHWLETRVLSPIVRFLRIPKLVCWYQAQIYNYFVQKACKLYPAIIDEIVSDLDGYSMVRPGIFGKVDGKAIHKKYWFTTEELEEKYFQEYVNSLDENDYLELLQEAWEDVLVHKPNPPAEYWGTAIRHLLLMNALKNQDYEAEDIS